MTDYLRPLTFPMGEIDNFIKRHKCGLCLSHLNKKFAPNQEYYPWCPEHGRMYENTVVKAGAAEQAEQNIMIGMRDLKPPKPKRTPEEILGELGF